MIPYVSAQRVAWRIGLSLSDLVAVAKDISSYYREWSTVDPKKGKARHFKVPNTELKIIQRRILKNILAEFPLPGTAHGGVKGKSPKTNAEVHVNQSLVVNIDIRDFFPSVDHRQVAKMFRREFGCGRETTWLLTRLTTVDGQLPQGAPTSTMIANILLSTPVDVPLGKKASRTNVRLSRFVDDITLSGHDAHELINDASAAVSRVGLRTWRKKKLSITPKSKRQEVTGLTVNSNAPSVPRHKRARIRTAIHQLRFTSQQQFSAEVASIKGRINHLRQFNAGSANRLERSLTRVLKERGAV